MSALGVHNFSPNWEPHTAAVIQKACKDKRDRGMLGHLQLSDRGGTVHSSGSSFITDHRLCLWRRQLGPLSAAGLLREQSLCAAGSVWGLGDGVKVSDTEVSTAQRQEAPSGARPTGCGSGPSKERVGASGSLGVQRGTSPSFLLVRSRGVRLSS